MNQLTMRLINTATLILREFNDENIPPYAILSHTWNREEVSFEQVTSLSRPQLEKLAGYRKIQRFCSELRDWNFDYAWVDTCCIDKRSSSELSEAINSMYRWYKNSKVCLAYLADIYGGLIAPNNSADCDSTDSLRLGTSRWFTRGWCLQELIAPSNMHFFDHAWRYLGSKHSLKNMITDITGIDEFSLFSSNLSAVSVSCKMSWAANRKTTRVEDIAYCLLGIFDINMPLLYGEGDKAFLRLQEEIIRQTEDHSIFVWDSAFAQSTSSMGGVLARHPSAFSRPIRTSRSYPNEPDMTKPFEPADVDSYSITATETWSVTSRGIRVQLPLLPRYGSEPAYLAVLGCQESSRRLALNVKPAKEGSSLFFRTSEGVTKLKSEEAAAAKKADLRTIYLLKADEKRKFDREPGRYCWLRAMEMARGLQYHLVDASPRSYWDVKNRIMPIFLRWSVTQIALSFKTSDGDMFALLLSVNPFDETAAIDLVEVESQQEAYLDNILVNFGNTNMVKERANAELEIGRARAFVVASVEVLNIREEKIFVVDMSVRDRSTFEAGILRSTIPSPGSHHPRLGTTALTIATNLPPTDQSVDDVAKVLPGAHSVTVSSGLWAWAATAQYPKG